MRRRAVDGIRLCGGWGGKDPKKARNNRKVSQHAEDMLGREGGIRARSSAGKRLQTAACMKSCAFALIPVPLCDITRRILFMCPDQSARTRSSAWCDVIHHMLSARLSTGLHL